MDTTKKVKVNFSLELEIKEVKSILARRERKRKREEKARTEEGKKQSEREPLIKVYRPAVKMGPAAKENTVSSISQPTPFQGPTGLGASSKKLPSAPQNPSSDMPDSQPSTSKASSPKTSNSDGTRSVKKEPTWKVHPKEGRLIATAESPASPSPSTSRSEEPTDEFLRIMDEIEKEIGKKSDNGNFIIILVNL